MAGNFIIRNVDAAPVEIADFGITIPAGADRDLHGFDFHEIARSYASGDLGAAITAADIVLLDTDGVTALSTLQTQALFNAFFSVDLARALRTITGDTGTFTINEPNEAFSLVGAGGLTVDISGGTITLDATAVALNDPGANGIVVRTAPNTTTTRTLVAPAAGITITNPDGVAGNPTFALANDLAALEGLGSTGFAVRTAADTWAQRTIVASTTAGRQGAHVNNGTGVAGNPEIGVDINNLTASGVNLVALDELIVFNGTNNLSYTGQQIADGVSALLGGVGNTYTTITGDAGSATAVTSTDTLNFTGVGITTSVANGAPDAVTLTLAIADLSAGVGPLVLADEIAVNDGGTTLRFTFTDVVEDLDIPYGITTDGILVRTAADTYASRTIVRSVAAGFEGVNVVNGDGIAGNPTVGVDINTLTSSGVNLTATNELIVFNGTNNLSYTGQQIADGVSTLLGGVATLSFVTIATPAGGPVVADTATDTLTLTQSTGLSITGTAGTDTINFAPANDLAAVEALATTGLATRTGVETWTTRTLVAPAAGITITDPAGIAGNPTFALANDLAALEGLAGTGIAVRTAADTWTNRTITGTAARITVTNGSGVAGDPTIDISATYVGQASITTLGTITTGVWNGTTVATGFGGTGLSAIGTANQVLGVNAGASALEYKSLVAGTNITIVHGVGTVTINSTGGGASLVLYDENPVAPTLPTATGTNAVAIGTGADATGLQAVAIGNNTSATGADAITIGDGSTAGADTMAIGFDATASGGNHAAVFGGNANTSTGNASTVLGGNNNLASAQSSVAIGERSVSDLFGGFAHAAGRFAADGDAQLTVCVLRTQTTTAAVTEAFLDGTGGTQRMVLPNDSTWAFRILVSARRTDANNESAVYQFVGGIDRNVGVGTTALIGGVSKTVVAEDTAAWDCNVNADTTNGSLRIQVTGEAAKTIRWVARAELVEVTG